MFEDFSALTLLLLITAILATGYTLTLCARNTSMQNWINSSRAKISACVTCAAAAQVRQHDPEAPLPKVCVINSLVFRGYQPNLSNSVELTQEALLTTRKWKSFEHFSHMGCPGIFSVILAAVDPGLL